MENPDPKRFKKLPEPVKLEETIETADADPHAPDHDGPWHDIEWTLKTAGGL